MTLAAPAFADNEQYRLDVPPNATAGQTLTGIRGSCGGEAQVVLLSDAFVGGTVTVGSGVSRFTTQAEIVDQPGTYLVTLLCSNEKAAFDSVTVA